MLSTILQQNLFAVLFRHLQIVADSNNLLIIAVLIEEHYRYMYDSLKIGGQTAPQLHIVYSKVNIK